jgi:hypothetical protein
MREKLGVKLEQATIGGVNVFVLTPQTIAPENQNRVFIHFHGGAYVLNRAGSSVLAGAATLVILMHRRHAKLLRRSRASSTATCSAKALGATRSALPQSSDVSGRAPALRVLPSRPGELHPEPLTDPDLTLSRHPARATARRLPPSVENWSSSCCQLARSQRR